MSPSPSEVVLVNDRAFVKGGIAKVALDEAIGLARRGWRVTLFAGVGPIDPRLPAAGVEVHVLDTPDISRAANVGGALSGFSNQRAARALRELLADRRKERCIVHFHSWTKSLSASVLPIPRSMGFHSILSAHDYFLACPNGGFVDYPRKIVCRRKPLGIDCILCNCDSRSYMHKGWRVLRQIYQDVILRAAEKIDLIASVSKFNLDRLKAHLRPDTELRVLNNPVEVEQLPPAEPGRNSYFLFVGRFSPEKGVVDFARAAAMAGVPARFVGEGPEQEAILDANPEADLRGWLSADGVRKEMRGARALVFPSIWYESQPLTVVEAMAEGVPVICSDVSAATEVVVAGERGLHFKAGSAEALATEIRKYGSDALVREMGCEAYRWYWSNPWSLDKHLDELGTLYEECFQMKPGKEKSG